MVNGHCQIKKAYETLKANHELTSVRFGHDKFVLQRLENVGDTKFNVTYKLIHYGTVILTVSFRFSDNLLCVNNGYGWSATDRNNMNALLQVLGIGFTRASIKQRCLMLDYDGKRVDEIRVGINRYYGKTAIRSKGK